MKISEHDHEMWYGDRSTANKMKGEALDKKFTNPLRIMNLGLQPFNQTDNIGCIKKRTNPKWPTLVQFFASGIQHLDLTQSTINQKRTLEVLACCIDNPVGKTTIKSLNLSKNHINKNGAKILAEVLAKNGTLEALDLSGNMLGVSGT